MQTFFKAGLFLLIFFLFGVYVAVGQNVTIEGTVTDSVENPLENTNVIATPLKDDAQTTFAITDPKGYYRLKLNKDTPYDIGLTHLGFGEVHDTLQFTADQTQDFILSESSQSLDEVKLESKMAVVVKEDTITYRTDQFETGDERKLREILKKLPGVEVDRDGNVKINGKRVSKLMVDGKDFFGGDTKLGVNNIPADAVEEIEALDDYNEVDFMKGLSDSDKMAMNIKLKKDKKHFMFGENEAGGGTKNKYYTAPKIFYYSPKTTINFIGNMNNTGESPLDYEDYMRFKGGALSLMDDPVDMGSDNLLGFVRSADAKFQKTEFGAANLSQDISPKMRLEAYTLASHQKRERQETNTINYFADENLEEQRETTGENKNFTSLSKAKLRYQPNSYTDMEYNVVATAKNTNTHNQIYSKLADSLNQTGTYQDPRNVEIGQYFRINYQPQYKHTWKIEGNYVFDDEDYITDWKFDKPTFPDIIPVEEEGDAYNFGHDYASTTHKGKLEAKHYWVLNNLNHIYPIGGLNFFKQDYSSADFQRLNNGETNSFADSGFDNHLNYRLINPYAGFQYKVKVGDVIFKPGIIYHHFLWKASQFGESTANKNKGMLLPEFKGEYEITASRKLTLKYNLRSKFQDAAQYADRLRLTGFNSIYRGNPELENERYHDVRLSYHNFNMGRGWTFYGNLNYERKEKSVKNTTELEGINQINTSIYSHLPENNYGADVSMTKRLGEYFKTSVRGQVNLSDYSLIVNEETRKYNNEHYSYTVGLETLFKKWPNIELNFNQRFNTSKSTDYENKYIDINPYAALRYQFLDGFIAKFDYNYTHYKNKTDRTVNRFDEGNASLYYSAEDSPWGFEIRAENIFDIRYKQSNYFDQFMAYDQRIYIQPRTVLFILSYQL